MLAAPSFSSERKEVSIMVHSESHRVLIGIIGTHLICACKGTMLPLQYISEEYPSIFNIPRQEFAGS